VARVRTRISYEYDFGDGWEHELAVEALELRLRAQHAV
jgi:pRiA4b ORF-3-like protein